MARAARHDRQKDYVKVLDVARVLAACCELDELLGVIVDRAIDLLDVERASLFLYDPARRELHSRIATGGQEIRFSVDAGVAGACARERATIHVPDAYADGRFNPAIDRQTGFRTRNILAVPLPDFQGQLVGVLQLLNKRKGSFTSHDIMLAESLGAHAGVALQRGVLLDHLVEKQRLEKSLDIAREIQQGLLPTGEVVFPGWEVAGWNRPADQTGGDTYDFFQLAQGRLGILLADASGHGIGPALVIAQTRAMVRALSLHENSIAPMMGTVSSLLAEDLDSGRFVTCFFGVLQAGCGVMEYISAGQGPLLIYRAATDSFEKRGATGPPLGVVPEAGYGQPARLELAEGDFLALTTDGFFEAVNPSGEDFGLQRVMDHLRASLDRPAGEMILRLTEAVHAFTAGAAQADDLTAVIARRTK